MKTTLAKQTMLWVLALLFGCALTVGLFALTEGVRHSPAAAPLRPSLRPIPATEPAPPPVPNAPPALSSRIVEYHISVALQADRHVLSGTQSVTWQNPGAKPVAEVYLHLYPNAFESAKTTFNRESGGKLRSDERKPDSVGSMNVLSIKTPQGENLTERLEFVQPDDGNANDRTLAKLTLPAPVPPGGKLTLDMDYTVKLPQVFARMGYAGDFVMAGQWFPKLAVYEPAGTRGRTAEGWNLHQYHGNSEFYSDFGIFDVKIKVPSGYIVAATGFPTRNAVEEEGSKVYRFYADDVHDFAWAASPHFIYYEEPFSAPSVPGVRIKLYVDPAHKDLKNRYMQAAKKALTRFSEWYGTYPYSTLSVVVPPADGNGAGGMEYPTLVTAWGAGTDNPGLELERVVVHEIGHQYWYGMVASNEFEEAWLDEGFTSYSEDKVMQAEYGAKPNLPLEASYVTSPEPLKRNSWAYGPHGDYADNVYTRAKLVLSAIERQAGEKTMSRILKTYFQRWSFQHPSTEDFQRVVEETTKKSWREFFDQYVYGGWMTDFAVESIRTTPIGKAGSGAGYDSNVLIRKLGGRQEPVPIVFHFSDGTTAEKTWDASGEEVQYKLSHETPVDWVQIDPNHTLVLENRHINNFMKTAVDEQINNRWNMGTAKILETLFGWVVW